ncbi:AMT1-1 [Symbiodinium sp. CCMP2592]|nr:AMT1-1 [Symbiodinium sp. CCMP2592]
MEMYHVVGALVLECTVIYYTEGRIRTSSPPFLLGLYWLSAAGTFIYVLLCVWFSMYASISSHSFGVRLLTRFIRLPIPGSQQINALNARLTDFERQGRKIMRIPFTKDVPQWQQRRDLKDQPDATLGMGEGDENFMTAVVQTGAMKQQDLLEEGVQAYQDDEVGLQQAAQNLPGKHIRLFRELQAKWQCYDAYARVSMSLGVNHICMTMSYYVIGLTVLEYRSPSIMFALVLVFQATNLALAWLDVAGLRRKTISSLEVLGSVSGAEISLSSACGWESVVDEQPGKAAHSKASIFYGADEYLEELKKKYEHDHEIAALKNALPGEGDPNAAGVAQSSDKMLSVQKNAENRSLKTNRLFPTPNKPDPMPQNLAFLFTKITPEQMIYMWNVLTAIFFTQVMMVIGYCAALACFPDYWWTCTLCFGLPFSYIAIQNIYIDHDVMHGATFPVYEWQRFLTHPFADFFSLPWEEFVLEHNRHHASTVDLLIQGEFGWDPEEFHYALQQWAGPWGSNWYKYLLTVPFIPVIHFFGLNDTGSLFALEWWMHFPDEGAGGKCNKEFWSKWVPRRVKHNAFVLGLWTCVWLLGTYPLGRPLSEGWRFMFAVSFFARVGYSAAWMFITNFTHSLPWNEFLAQDPGRTWPVLHNVMAMVLGGKHRWNEMLFHDVHHAFPNAVGTLSQRGRFHGWEKVHDAAAEVLHRGLWKPNGDEETQMQKTQKKRSLMMKQGK